MERRVGNYRFTQQLMESGATIEYDTVTGWWKDTGTPEDILHANRLILRFYRNTRTICFRGRGIK